MHVSEAAPCILRPKPALVNQNLSGRDVGKDSIIVSSLIKIGYPPLSPELRPSYTCGNDFWASLHRD